MINALVIDDDESILELIEEQLEGEGIKVTRSLSAGEAIAYLQTMKYDIIISDIKMPDIDGRVLLDTAAELQPNIGRIIITGHGDDFEYSKKTRGIYRLQKPYELRDLVVLVYRLYEQGTSDVKCSRNVDPLVTLKQAVGFDMRSSSLSIGDGYDLGTDGGVLMYNSSINGVIIHRSPLKIIIDWTILKDIDFECSIHKSQEFVIVCSGQVDIEIEDEVVNLVAPSAYKIDAGIPHIFRVCKNTRFTTVCTPYKGYKAPQISIKGEDGYISPSLR